MSLTDLYNSFQVDSWAEMFTWLCKWLLGGGLEPEDALKLWEKTLSREVAQIIIICAGHPVLASASNDGWPPIKTYLFGG